MHGHGVQPGPSQDFSASERQSGESTTICSVKGRKKEVAIDMDLWMLRLGRTLATPPAHSDFSLTFTLMLILRYFVRCLSQQANENAKAPTHYN
jgi:hypothetical protein